MSIIAAKSDYIEKANQTYLNLKEYENVFAKEAKIMSYVKCSLLRKEELNDFNIGGTRVSVYQTNNGYQLFFENYKLKIEVYNCMIVDFDLS